MSERTSGVYAASQLSCGREQSRELLAKCITFFDRSEAEKIFQEEREACGKGRKASSVLTSLPKDPASLRKCFEAGAQVCLLYGLGKCRKSEQHCGKAHVCPFCAKPEKGCIAKNQMGSINHHVSNSAGDARSR